MMIEKRLKGMIEIHAYRGAGKVYPDPSTFWVNTSFALALMRALLQVLVPVLKHVHVVAMAVGGDSNNDTTPHFCPSGGWIFAGWLAHIL